MAEDTEVVRTRRIEVVDSEGVPRVILGVERHGGGEQWGIVVRTATGKDGTGLVVDGEAATLVFVHGGNVVAAVGSDERGNPEVVVSDPNGAPVAGLSRGGCWQE